MRDYLGICELQIIDAEKYKRVVKAEREKIAKVSVNVLNCVVGQFSTNIELRTIN